MTKKVIIIDDSLAQLNLVKVFFTNNLWEVYSTQNAKVGYDMIFDIAPDLIIVDAIMPHIGGFKFVNMTREHPAISEIPIIVYSVISKLNANIYIHEDKAEYYLNKSDNLNELLDLANKLIQKHPIDENYKSEILKYGILNIDNNYTNLSTIKKIDEDIFDTHEKIIINDEELKTKIKNIYNFSNSDDKLFVNLFEILYPILKYNACLISVISYETGKKKLFFDTKGILLSPIFQNKYQKKYEAENICLFKKYTPNLMTIVNENEFMSKIEFNFYNKQEYIASISIWSKDKEKYEQIDNLDEFKNILFNFFYARYVNKSNTKLKSEPNNKYAMYNLVTPFLNMFDMYESKNNIYIAIARINNYSSLRENSSIEEFDLINSKISQSIINQLEYTEQVYKSSQDEYTIMFFAKDNKHAQNKLNNIANILCEISNDNEHIDVAIGASRCMINEEFNVNEAKKLAIIAIDEISTEEKVMVK